MRSALDMATVLNHLQLAKETRLELEVYSELAMANAVVFRIHLIILVFQGAAGLDARMDKISHAVTVLETKLFLETSLVILTHVNSASAMQQAHVS